MTLIYWLTILFIFYSAGFAICLRTTNKKITSALFIITVFIATFPRIGWAINIGLDESWAYALNYLFYNKLQFGKDILYTYGPLGFLYVPEPIGNNLLIAIFFNSIKHLLVVGNIIWLITQIHERKKVAFMVAYSMLAIWIINFIYSYDFPTDVLLIASLILNYHLSRKNIFMFIASLWVAISFLIKPGIAIWCLSVMGSYLMIELLIYKNYKLLLQSVAVVVFLFSALWFLIYRNFGSIPKYLFSTLQFIKGHESAMSINPSNNWTFIALSLLVILFLIFYLKEKRVYLITCMFLLFAFEMFKYAFVREDAGHYLYIAYALIIFFFLISIQLRSLKKIVIFYIGAFISLSLVCLNFNETYKRNDLNTLFSLMALATRISGIKNISDALKYKSYREQLVNESDKNLEKQRLSAEILAVLGQSSVDVYPWDTTFIHANSLNWRPRPVFQSQVSYTPWLDEFNANFFASKDAPGFIIWTTEHQTYSIDARYLLNDEPKTIFKIIKDYEPILYDEHAVLFRKKETPTFQEPNELFAKSYRWNEWIDVPISKDSVIRSKIHFRRTPYGKIKRFLWKEIEVFIDYKLNNGETKTHRLVIDNAISGVWIHPYVIDISSALKSGTNKVLGDKDNLFHGSTVTQVRLRCKDKKAFEKYFSIVWEESKLNS